MTVLTQAFVASAALVALGGVEVLAQTNRPFFRPPTTTPSAPLFDGPLLELPGASAAESPPAVEPPSVSVPESPAAQSPRRVITPSGRDRHASPSVAPNGPASGQVPRSRTTTIPQSPQLPRVASPAPRATPPNARIAPQPPQITIPDPGGPPTTSQGQNGKDATRRSRKPLFGTGSDPSATKPGQGFMPRQRRALGVDERQSPGTTDPAGRWPQTSKRPLPNRWPWDQSPSARVKADQSSPAGATQRSNPAAPEPRRPILSW